MQVLTDESTRIIGFNDSAIVLFGYERKDTIGKTVEEVLIYEEELIHVHRSYVAQYHKTKERRLIGTPRIVIARHVSGSPISGRFFCISVFLFSLCVVCDSS